MHWKEVSSHPDAQGFDVPAVNRRHNGQTSARRVEVGFETKTIWFLCPKLTEVT